VSRIIKIEVIDDNLVLGSSGSLGSGFVEILREQRQSKVYEINSSGTSFELESESSNYHIREQLNSLVVKKAFYFAGHSNVKTITASAAEQELDTLKFYLKLLNSLDSLKVFIYSSSVLASLPNDYLASLRQADFRGRLTLYSKTKLMAESIICDYLKSSSIKYVLLNRYTNVFGKVPFGTDSLFSYILKEILKPNSIIQLSSSVNSRINFVYDAEVHRKLVEYVTKLDLDQGPCFKINYIVESQSLSIGEWMTRFRREINPGNAKFIYGNQRTFWDFFLDPSPIISPNPVENKNGFQRMVKHAVQSSTFTENAHSNLSIGDPLTNVADFR
jgi:nucleoside-diphosphate-sugar epimerase